MPAVTKGGFSIRDIKGVSERVASIPAHKHNHKYFGPNRKNIDKYFGPNRKNIDKYLLFIIVSRTFSVILYKKYKLKKMKN
jgi:hypothetical protein